MPGAGTLCYSRQSRLASPDTRANNHAAQEPAVARPAAAANGDGTPDLAALATSLKSKAERRAAGGAFAETALRDVVYLSLYVESSGCGCSPLA